jgi:prepilin-type N-terminal cleavage/methylation domain-containing protein
MFKTTKKIINQKGFTLLEIIVAMGIFSVSMLMATQIFQTILQGQNNTLASQNIQENFRFALEMMSKEMRNAQFPIGNCYNAVSEDDKNTFSACNQSDDNPVGGSRKGVGLGAKLIFRNKYGECVKYYLDTVSNQIKVVRMVPGIYNNAFPITPTSIKVTSFKVFVDDNDPVINSAIYAQPTATLNLTAEVVTNKASSKNPINLQTSVSARAYNRY